MRINLRRLMSCDFDAFAKGIEDQELRRLYGLPNVMDEERKKKIFDQFVHLDKAFAIMVSDRSVGFLLCAKPELPQELASMAKGTGNTLAFATYPTDQRKGYMEEALRMCIRELFETGQADYIHCGYFDFNQASEKLLRKLGFERIGTHQFKGSTIVDMIISKKA